MTMQFKKATKAKQKLRLGLVGVAGSGKTYSALAIATALGQRVAVIDTEHGSASLYADRFEFDTLALESFHPQQYIDAIQAAADAGYDVVIIDSLSHAWMGKDGALELVDRAAKRSQSGNSFAAWRDVTPLHNRLVEAMLAAPVHLIITMRSKTEYVLEKDEKTGKSTPRKVGMQAVQRDGLEYEFTVVGDLDVENTLTISKTRCSALAGASINKPGEQIAAVLLAWLDDGGQPTAAPTDGASKLSANASATEAQIATLWTLSEHAAVPADVATKVGQRIKAGNISHATAANWIATMTAQIAEHEKSHAKGLSLHA